MSKNLQCLFLTVAFTMGLSGLAVNAASPNSNRQGVAVEVSGGNHFMGSQLRGIMAAPNQCEIKAKVQRIEQSTQFPDKWYLELEILESKNISGGTFAQVGDKIKAFTISSNFNFSINNIITAQAEFLGDTRGGLFRLSNVQLF